MELAGISAEIIVHSAVPGWSKNVIMRQRHVEQNMPQKVKQQDGRTGQEKPERAVQQTDLPLYIVRASGVIPDV